MAWNGVLGHDNIVHQFLAALQNGRLASTYLFLGPSGIGKRLFARTLAQALFCEQSSPAELNPCNQCPACQQVRAGSHPDLIQVSLEDGKSAVSIAQIAGDDEHRGSQGLCYELHLKPFSASRRVAIIDDADYLSVEAANAMLKTIEEPPPGALIILIGTSRQRQFPTVLSRSQVINFLPLEVDQLVESLSSGLIEEPQQAETLASLAGGSVERALTVSDESFLETRRDFYSTLSQLNFDLPSFCKSLDDHVKNSGKAASDHRNTLRGLIDLALLFYHQLQLKLIGTEIQGDNTMLSNVEQLASNWQHDVDSVALCINRCFDAYEQVERNANRTPLIYAWIDQIRQVHLTGRL